MIENQTMNQKRILIIDDEFPMRYLIEHQLKESGFAVSLAKDGPDGLKAALLDKPDLIVLDAMMPNMDGFEVCRQIKSDNDPDIAKIPVIFLTANESREYQKRAYKVGADDYLTKPFQPDELIAHVSAVIRRTEKIHTGLFNAHHGQVVSMFSPKGGVGTTTLAIQLAEAILIHEDRPVALLDLDLPFGGIAPMLNLDTRNSIVDLLNIPHNRLDLSLIQQFSQPHRANMLVIPAPGRFISPETRPLSSSLRPVLDHLIDAGYQVILDLGSTLTRLTGQALRQSDLVFLVTSGQPVANRLVDDFLAMADQLGLEKRRLMPVVNENHGAITNVELSRIPVARIPHASEQSRTRLWLKEQGMRKMVSIMC
ncbi:MAG TPA: response regulator [Chloroflexi bacterium]|nr:response regulator [Chloroflexota bacterium]